MDAIGKLIRAPVLIVTSDRSVTEMNTRARRIFGADVAVWSDVFADEGKLRALLSRASGLGDPVLGAVDIRERDGTTRRRRVEVLALRDGTAVRYAIEIRDSEDDQFAVLTQRVRELNAEIAVRQRTQAQLEDALGHNDLLYRELQHRVKNHLQMMLALVSAAARETSDPDQRAFVRTLQGKLSALFDAQRLMYAGPSAAGVPVEQMLTAIADTVQALAGAHAAIEVAAEPTLVPHDIAFPVALITNELLTNAVKYASRDRAASVWVTLRRDGADALLAVQDNGPGFLPAQTTRASSGLGLVRGLCRQIGARLRIDSDGAGTVAHVCFPLPESAHASH